MSKKLFDEYVKRTKYLFLKHDYDRGILELEHALDIYIDNDYKFDFPEVFKNLHISYRSITDQAKYANIVLSIIDMLKEKKQFIVMAAYITHLSASLSQLGNFKESVELLKRGLEILQDVECVEVKSKLENGIGNYYFSLGDFEQAKKYYTSVLNKAKTLDSTDWYKYGHNLGNTYKELKQYEKSLEFLHLGEQFFLGQKDLSTRSNSFCDLATVYYLIDDYKTSEDYLDKAYAIAVDLDLASQLLDITRERMYLYARWKKYQLAFKYQEAYYERLRAEDINKSKTKLLLPSTTVI